MQWKWRYAEMNNMEVEYNGNGGMPKAEILNDHWFIFWSRDKVKLNFKEIGMFLWNLSRVLHSLWFQVRKPGTKGFVRWTIDHSLAEKQPTTQIFPSAAFSLRWVECDLPWVALRPASSGVWDCCFPALTALLLLRLSTASSVYALHLDAYFPWNVSKFDFQKYFFTF